MHGNPEKHKSILPKTGVSLEAPVFCPLLPLATEAEVLEFIEPIRVGKRIPGTHEVPIEIHWNF